MFGKFSTIITVHTERYSYQIPSTAITSCNYFKLEESKAANLDEFRQMFSAVGGEWKQNEGSAAQLAAR